jgi:hypothetical protein
MENTFPDRIAPFCRRRPLSTFSALRIRSEAEQNPHRLYLLLFADSVRAEWSTATGSRREIFADEFRVVDRDRKRARISAKE